MEHDHQRNLYDNGGHSDNATEPGLARSNLPCLPSGYRFKPLDSELMIDYLHPKIHGAILPQLDLIHQINIYDHNPDYLSANFEAQGDQKWYFFTPRERQYPNGTRPSRKADGGYWRATGALTRTKLEDKDIIGYKRALVFHKEELQKLVKTSWLMHEYFMVSNPPQANNKRKRTPDHEDTTSMKLDEFVLCKIYKKEGNSNPNKSQAQEEEVEEDNHLQDDAGHDEQTAIAEEAETCLLENIVPSQAQEQQVEEGNHLQNQSEAQLQQVEEDNHLQEEFGHDEQALVQENETCSFEFIEKALVQDAPLQEPSCSSNMIPIGLHNISGHLNPAHHQPIILPTNGQLPYYGDDILYGHDSREDSFKFIPWD